MEEGTRRLHVVDGTYELFRAHFARTPPRLARGADVKATVGLVGSLLGLLQDPREAVTHLAVAFDNPIRSFRNDLFPGYKSDEGVPPDLRAQFDLAELATAAMGVRVWSMRAHEADDALASAAAKFSAQVDQVRLMTPDKDLSQCVRSTRVVQVDRQRGNLYDEPAVRAKWGVGPASIPDLLALVGDAADGLPGIAGFGLKTAALLLAEYEHLEAIPASASEWRVKPRRAEVLASTLAGALDEALLYRRLATLVESVPLEESLEALEFGGIPRESFLKVCRELGVDGLASRVNVWR